MLNNMEDELVEAALNGNLEEVKHLLSQGVDIDVSNGAPLHRASYAGHTDVVKYLLSQKADPNANYTSALNTAAYKGNLDIAKALVDAKADIHAENYQGVEEEVLINAAAGGSIPMVNYLLSQGAIVLDWDDEIIAQPVYMGHLPMVKYLEKIGIAEGGENVITSLAIGGHINMALYLLSQGYNLNPDETIHPAKIALDNGKYDMARFLVEEANVYPSHLLKVDKRLQDYRTRYAEAISLIRKEADNLSSLIARYY